MSVPNLWYGLAEVWEPAEALVIERADQTVPIFVCIPDDPKLAKALRRADYYVSLHWPAYYVRRPKGRAKDFLRLYLAHRDGGARCFYCGDDTIPLGVLSLDHVIPESRGGTRRADNLVLACRPCNHDKDDRTPDEWRAGVIRRRRHCRTDEERAAYDAIFPRWGSCQDSLERLQ